MSRPPLRTLFLAPAAVIVVVLILTPLGFTAAYSVLTRGSYGGAGLPLTSENFRRVFDAIYGGILIRSFAMAGAATAISVAMAFPVALFITRAKARKRLYLQLVMLPFWTSILVRLYAWMFLLRDSGLINTALLGAGLIRDPLPLLYNNGAVLLGLVYSYLPFAVLPIYASLERMDNSLLEAAADLGARPLEALRRVVVPLSAPGIRSAAILVFVPALGTFLVSDLLGGGKTILIGNVVQNQFTTARDWPFGAAVTLAFMAVVMTLLVAVLRRDRDALS